MQIVATVPIALATQKNKWILQGTTPMQIVAIVPIALTAHAIDPEP